MKRRSGIQRSAWILTVLTCLIAFLPASRAIICYRCTVLPARYVDQPDQPCSKFDGSSRFYQDCPASTFCMKRVIHYQLRNNTIITTAERDCASQKYSLQDYNYQENKWYKREKIDTEAYTVGCFQGENRGTPSEYCFCDSNYCNGSTLMTNSLCSGSLLVTAVLLILGLF